MLKGIAAALTVWGILASPAVGQSLFDGSWKVNLNSVEQAPHPEVIILRKGVFTCRSCDHPFHLRADGKFHKVQGQDGFDTASVRVTGARSFVRTNRLKTRVVRVETRTLAPDGKSATLTFTDTINEGIAPVSGKQTLMRTAPGPAGAHALSGTWVHQTATEVSENALIQTFLIKDDTLTMTTGEGFSYTARLDGTPARASGDPLVDTVSVTVRGDRQIEEVDSGKGGIIARYTYSLSADGVTLTITLREEKTGKVSTMTAGKQ